MADFFGYDRKIKSSNQLASSEYAALRIGGKVNLCQQVEVTYKQDVKPIYEVGNPSIFFVPGHASGTIRFGRLAGADSFFKQLRDKPCGKLTGVSISSEGAGTCSASSGSLSFDGAVIVQVGLSMSTQAIEITESADIVVASMN